MHRAALRLAIVATLVAACSSNTPTTAPGATSAATAGTGGSGAPPSTGPGQTAGEPGAPSAATGGVVLPAGAQFEPAETLPSTGAWGMVSASEDGKTLMVPGRSTKDGTFRLAVSANGGPWEDRPFIDAAIPGPSGYDPDTLDNGWLRAFVVDMASSPAGTVVVGTREFRSSSGRATIRSAIWFSADGSAWKRTALADVLGGDVAVQVNGVMAVNDGFVAVATVSDVALKQPSTIEVIRSADGVTWKRAGSIATEFSLGADIRLSCAMCRSPLTAAGGNLLLVGEEYACDTAAAGMVPTRFAGIRWGSQLRLWSSGDGGTSWSAVDLKASGVVTSTKPAPTSKADCPDLSASGAVEAFDAAVRTRGTFAGVMGGRVVLLDGQRTAASDDLVTWSVADVPGLVPESGYTILPAGPRLLSGVPGAMALVALDPQRTTTNHAIGPNYQAIVWTSTNGAAWTRLEASPAAIALPQPASGRLWLLSSDVAVLQGAGIFRRSFAGPLIPATP